MEDEQRTDVAPVLDSLQSTSSIDRNLLERDEMMVATARAMRVAAVIPSVPEIYASWREATREAIDVTDEPVRAVVEGLLREMLGFIAAVREDERIAASLPLVPGSQERAGGS